MVLAKPNSKYEQQKKSLEATKQKFEDAAFPAETKSLLGFPIDPNDTKAAEKQEKWE